MTPGSLSRPLDTTEVSEEDGTRTQDRQHGEIGNGENGKDGKDAENEDDDDGDDDDEVFGPIIIMSCKPPPPSPASPPVSLTSCLLPIAWTARVWVWAPVWEGGLGSARIRVPVQ